MTRATSAASTTTTRPASWRRCCACAPRPPAALPGRRPRLGPAVLDPRPGRGGARGLDGPRPLLVRARDVFGGAGALTDLAAELASSVTGFAERHGLPAPGPLAAEYLIEELACAPDGFVTSQGPAPC